MEFRSPITVPVYSVEENKSIKEYTFKSKKENSGFRNLFHWPLADSRNLLSLLTISQESDAHKPGPELLSMMNNSWLIFKTQFMVSANFAILYCCALRN